MTVRTIEHGINHVNSVELVNAASGYAVTVVIRLVSLIMHATHK